MLIKNRISHVQIIALGFFLTIAVGTALLMLPAATYGEGGASFIEALFTSTSAACVTGLVLRDTATYWSTFGQVVIIILIQIGGLGFMTIATMFFLFMRKKVGLRNRAVMSESVNFSSVGKILSHTRLILTGTLLVELCGAILLSIRFIPVFGWGRGIYYGIFHSISAFCNAGFDLMGVWSEYSSFTAWSGDILVNVTLMALIIVGGIGFLIWEDVAVNKLHLKRYSLHSKIVLAATLILVVGGAAVFFVLELGATGAGRPVYEQVVCAFFNSVTARTAGFNTVDVAALSDGSKLLMTILMFIGGSPGSTAGGVKTATVAVIALYSLSRIRGQHCTEIFGRRITDDTIKKAYTVVTANLTLALVGTIIVAASGIALSDSLLEVFSAIGTVGLSTGATRDLNTFGRLIVILLMYTGRLGSVTFASALLEKKARPPVSAPAGEITIG